MSQTPAGEVVLAHHALLLAIPAFVPALLIVGVVLVIAVRDRRAEAEEAEQSESNPDDRSETT